MNKIIFTWLCFQAVIFSQYFGERVTDQSFEKSQLYFNSHFLNTYGLYQFKDIAPGMINDPFLNIYLNPAMLPDLGDKNISFYLDFRGDRTEAPIYDDYRTYDYFYRPFIPTPYPSPGWFTDTEIEPEPIFSLGFLAYPFTSNKNFYVGGSYQYVNSEDKYYSMPYFIYSPLFGYDAFNNQIEMSSVPIVDRSSGKDEIINETHMFTGFAGYRISGDFLVGAFLNGVLQTKDGEYSNTSRDEYGSSDGSKWNSSYLNGRTIDYDHLDYSLGVLYSPSECFYTGLKAGYLDGKVKQDFTSGNFYSSTYNDPYISEEWYDNYSQYSSKQLIDHDGSSKYLTFNFQNVFKKKAILRGYYRYTNSDISVVTTSNVADTSNYSSRWVYEPDWGMSSGNSSVDDIRTGTGNRTTNRHEGLLSLSWNVSEKTSLTVGVYYKNELYEIGNNEDVYARRNSDWEYSSSNYDPENYSILLIEDKMLKWKYESKNTTLQIPVIFNFNFNEYWGMMLGISRILNTLKISEQTTAYFDRRYTNENGLITEENNFGERYTQPDQKISDNYFDVMTGFHLNISKDFGMRLLLDPEIDPDLRIAQWWLSFKASI